MPTNVIMPALGVAQETGTLLKWLKAEGETVSKGEPLMEIETDKATVEIEAAASGHLAQVTAKAGDQVPVGHTIALILAPGEALPTRKEESLKIAPERERPRVAQEAQSNPAASPFVKGGSKEDVTTRILASPKAKRIAREQRIDLKSLRGSGPEGAVLAADVLRAVVGSAESPPSGVDQITPQFIPLTSMRRIVGERMAQSKQNAPHFYLSMEIDMTGVKSLRDHAKERGDEIVPSINDVVLYACARSLIDFPTLNSSFTDQGIQQHADVNIGMAVALDEGLVVPVIRGTNRLSLADLSRQSRELAAKAQNKKLTPLDYEGGTFTVSNLGMLGVDNFVAIINPPQAAILAVGRVAPRVVTDGEGIEVKPIMAATLSADHRVVDGASAARFLQRVKELLENIRF